MNDSLDNDIVVYVAQQCNCDEQAATILLAKSNHDPEKAIKLHEILSKYRKNPKPSHTATPAPSKAAFPGGSTENYTSNDRFQFNPDQETKKRSAQNHGNSMSEFGGYTQLPDHNNNTKSSFPGNRLNSRIAGETSNPNSSPTNDNEPEWDFVLPVIPFSMSKTWPDLAGTYETFNLRELVGAMQNGASLQSIQNYLERGDRAKIREQINDDVDGFPAMFYVVETNKEAMLQLWVTYGGNPAAVHKQSKIPLLAFAIMHSENIQTDTTLITATLLSLGASPEVIPTAFYSPYMQDLPEFGLSDDVLKDLDDENKKYCKGSARMKLSRTTTLSQRYYLERAAKTKKPSVRQTQVAQKRNAEPLLGIANFLIGQNMAAKTLLDKLLSHLTVPSKKPLVLVFAGPSGHGKTELARRLGTLLSLELEVVDCTLYSRENELFGPRQPYVGWDKGSRLNNFITSNHGKRCIVFLDEFEKTNSDIHKTLLLPFDNGEYQDRRSGDKIDCSQIVWILATNAHDRIIQDFSAANNSTLFMEEDEVEKERLLKQLSKLIKQDFLAHHGSPITGRISGFVPFLPFSKGEQAAIVHKYFLELGRSIRTPVNLAEGDNEQLIGDVKLRIRRDATVCGILAESEYHIDLGARSLISAVDSIKTSMVEAYLGIDEKIAEGGGISEIVLDVNGGEVEVKMVAPRGW